MGMQAPAVWAHVVPAPRHASWAARLPRQAACLLAASNATHITIQAPLVPPASAGWPQTQGRAALPAPRHRSCRRPERPCGVEEGRGVVAAAGCEARRDQAGHLAEDAAQQRAALLCRVPTPSEALTCPQTLRQPPAPCAHMEHLTAASSLVVQYCDSETGTNVTPGSGAALPSTTAAAVPSAGGAAALALARCISVTCSATPNRAGGSRSCQQSALAVAPAAGTPQRAKRVRQCQLPQYRRSPTHLELG